MSEVLVLGHRNPDTDSICASITYAFLRNTLAERGVQDPVPLPGPAVPVRLGKVRPETRFVLQYFGVPEPRLVEDVRARVADAMKEEPVTVTPDTPLLTVGELFRAENVKLVAVVDEEKRLLGVVTAGDIARRYLEGYDLNTLEESPTTVRNLVLTLRGELVAGEDYADRLLHGKVVIAAMSPQALRERVEPGDVVLVADRPEAQLASLEAGASCLILTGGFYPTPEVITRAREKRACIITVRHDTYQAARIIGLSQAVENTMNREVVAFSPDDLLNEVREKMLAHKHRNYPVLDEERHLLGLISRGSLVRSSGKRVILVDHNERGQSAEGIEEAEVLEIIDHHRLGDLQTVTPVYFRNEPVGSTSTIIATMYRECGLTPSREMAGLMLAGILSDTLLFKSPTCTPRDREMALLLARQAGVEWETFGREMLKAGTDLANLTPAEILRRDFKEFRLGKGRYGIGQFETVAAEEVARMKGELLREMEKLQQDGGYDLVLLMVTDILREGTDLYVVGPAKGLVTQAFGLKPQDGVVFLPGVMSRKKQVVPPLARAIEASRPS